MKLCACVSLVLYGLELHDETRSSENFYFSGYVLMFSMNVKNSGSFEMLTICPLLMTRILKKVWFVVVHVPNSSCRSEDQLFSVATGEEDHSIWRFPVLILEEIRTKLLSSLISLRIKRNLHQIKEIVKLFQYILTSSIPSGNETRTDRS